MQKFIVKHINVQRPESYQAGDLNKAIEAELIRWPVILWEAMNDKKIASTLEETLALELTQDQETEAPSES